MSTANPKPTKKKSSSKESRPYMAEFAQVKKMLYKVRVTSKVVTYYKKRKREHIIFPNVLERLFKPGKKEIPTVACDINEFRLVNGMKVYFCAALDISTRRVLGYSLDTC
ncbi:hypothetical protein [Bacillus cereus group sp. RP43]|uniref:hypothetical protein n=1 Tax=Bacillus cereus group sp. RP43 TaxID=3040260 RepID=UPI0033950945